MSRFPLGAAGYLAAFGGTPAGGAALHEVAGAKLRPAPHIPRTRIAVLPSERIVEFEGPAEQCDLVDCFVDEALSEARRGLGVPGDDA